MGAPLVPTVEAGWGAVGTAAECAAATALTRSVGAAVFRAGALLRTSMGGGLVTGIALAAA